MKLKKAHTKQPLYTAYTSPLYYYLPFIAAIFTFIIYLPSLTYSFQFDDSANILKHFYIRHWTFKQLFFQHPRWISYWLNTILYSIGHFNPFYYRLFNVLVHISSGLLVFHVFFTGLGYLCQHSFLSIRKFELAFITALLFLLHPVQTQTVSYVIQGQLEGLAGFFILSIISCFFALTRARTIYARFLCTGLLVQLTLLSTGTKEIAIISPALVLLSDWFFIAQSSIPQIIKRLWIHILVWCTVISAYLYVLKPQFFKTIFSLQPVPNNLGNILTQQATDLITPLHYAMSQFKVILHYIAIFFWPFNMSVDYDWKLVTSFFARDCLLPFIILITLLYSVYYLAQRIRIHPIVFGTLWFFIAIMPRSSFIPSTELIADYKTYIASVGWLFIGAWAFTKAFLYFYTYTSLRRYSYNRIFIATSIILAGILGITTFTRNTVWRSTEDFWANVIRQAPYKARGYNNFAVALCERKRYQEALPYLRKALELDPTYAEAYMNLALVYGSLGSVEQEIKALKRAIALHPYSAESYNNLANAFVKIGELEKAEKALTIALKIKPHYGKALYGMGNIALKLNNPEKSWHFFKACCIEGDFDNEHGFLAYGKASITLSKLEDAQYAYQKALTCNPQSHPAKVGLANTYLLAKKYTQAEQAYTVLIRESPQDHDLIYALAETYFFQGTLEKACSLYHSLEKNTEQFPALYLRLAACYDQLGNSKLAYTYLQHTLQHTYIPEDIKCKAQKALIYYTTPGRNS